MILVLGMNPGIVFLTMQIKIMLPVASLYFVTILLILLFLIHFHLPNVITRSHCLLLNHIFSFARFILVSMLICVITSLSFIFHLLLGLDYILTNVFLYIFSHTPFLFFLFLIG